MVSSVMVASVPFAGLGSVSMVLFCVGLGSVSVALFYSVSVVSFRAELGSVSVTLFYAMINHGCLGVPP